MQIYRVITQYFYMKNIIINTLQTRCFNKQTNKHEKCKYNPIHNTIYDERT